MFQSTHPHGVRLGSEGRQGLHQRQFQSTHPHGVRPSPDGGFKLNNTLVSIHAPTRGATTTLVVVLCIFILGVSIHAPTRGATLEERHIDAKVESFQSTHPHGVRRLSVPSSSPWSSFNPRTHTGCDIGFSQPIAVHIVSIHAPTRGATNWVLWLMVHWFVSIHAPTRGATKMVRAPGPWRPVSIHAPTRGATVCKVTYYKSIN